MRSAVGYTGRTLCRRKRCTGKDRESTRPAKPVPSSGTREAGARGTRNPLSLPGRSRTVWTRALAALGVGVWCFFVLFAGISFMVDRGLAGSPWAWLAFLGIVLMAPVVLMQQISRAIAMHEQSRRAAPSAREKEKELLRALEERGELTPATAAMRTSLTVEEASKILDKLAGKGHLQVLNWDGVLAYTTFREQDRRELPKKTSTGLARQGSGDGEAPKSLDEPLSERELEVLALLASGRTNREIARDLFVTVGTVKSHTTNIYGKLGARNRTEALSRARGLGLLK